VKILPAGLATFHAVAHAKSIRKASIKLGVEPSSVSRQIAILERQMGTKLLERTSTGVLLTHAGALLDEYAKGVLLDFESLRADLDDQRGSRRRLIRLATVESIVSGGPLLAVGRFREKFDGVTFKVSVMPASAVIDSVVQGECDIGLAFCAQPHPEVLTMATVAEPIVLAVPADHEWASAQSVHISDLLRHPLALPDLSFGVRGLFERACNEANVTINPVLVSNDFEALREFVLCGSGLAVLPVRAIARDRASERLVPVPISVKALRDTTVDVIVSKRRLPRIVRLFAQELSATVAKLAGSWSDAPHGLRQRLPLQRTAS